MKKEISVRAKVVRELLRLATSERLLGPQIKNGMLSKKVHEAPWHPPDGYSLLRVKAGGCDVEILTPPQVAGEKAVLQLHGGGYIGRMKNRHRNFAKRYSDAMGGIKVFSADYRVAPKHPYPAALQDAYSAYCMLLNLGYRGKELVLAGDSAGGGLCLALAAYLRDQGKELPAAMVLMSPWTDLTASGESYEKNFYTDPLFGGTKESMIYSGQYYQGHDPSEPYISPLFGSFEGLPPMLFQVGSEEMLLSDSVDAAKKARESGCQVRLSVYEGMFHVFQTALERLPESEKAWEEALEFTEEIFSSSCEQEIPEKKGMQ
ncbi:MAG: alpha/beta hydrolase [Clostridiaceae bacterium]|nr:alpha/beta hydrolase [Clostridiaceae bacterium]